MNVASEVKFVDLLHLKSVSIGNSQIILIFNHLYVIDEANEFPIIFVILERSDWNSVSKLSTKRVDSIINDNQIFQISTLEDSKILNVYVVSTLDAMLTV